MFALDESNITAEADEYTIPKLTDDQVAPESTVFAKRPLLDITNITAGLAEDIIKL